MEAKANSVQVREVAYPPHRRCRTPAPHPPGMIA